jgi:hypothetical protein
MRARDPAVAPPPARPFPGRPQVQASAALDMLNEQQDVAFGRLKGARPAAGVVGAARRHAGRPAAGRPLAAARHVRPPDPTRGPQPLPRARRGRRVRPAAPGDQLPPSGCGDACGVPWCAQAAVSNDPRPLPLARGAACGPQKWPRAAAAARGPLARSSAGGAPLGGRRAAGRVACGPREAVFAA